MDPKYEQFDSLIERYRKLIRKLCWRHSVGSESLCDELVQDCYISIWCHLPSLRPDCHHLQLTAWVVFQCRSVFSHRDRRKEFDWEPIDEHLADTLPANEPNDRHEFLEGLAEELSESEHRLLSLLLEGFSRGEIAEKMNMSVEAVNKMRQRLIKKLKDNGKDYE